MHENGDWIRGWKKKSGKMDNGRLFWALNSPVISFQVFGTVSRADVK
jgi:hypothetical protein